MGQNGCYLGFKMGWTGCYLDFKMGQNGGGDRLLGVDGRFVDDNGIVRAKILFKSN
jgi:hypothetical protein